jgi:hypothetical protein
MDKEMVEKAINDKLDESFSLYRSSADITLK